MLSLSEDQSHNLGVRMEGKPPSIWSIVRAVDLWLAEVPAKMPRGPREHQLGPLRTQFSQKFTRSVLSPYLS